MSGMDKTQLLGMTPDELTVYFKQLGQPAFRARQVFAWLHQGADFEQMSNLPKALRETLDENCVANPVSVLETIESKLDGTIKLLYAPAGRQRHRRRADALQLRQHALPVHAGGLPHGLRVLRLHAGRLRAQPDRRRRCWGRSSAPTAYWRRKARRVAQHRADGQRRTAG